MLKKVFAVIIFVETLYIFLQNSNLIVQHLFEIVKTFIMLQNISVSFDQFKASLGELRINFFLFNHTYPKLLNSSFITVSIQILTAKTFSTLIKISIRKYSRENIYYNI